MIVILAILPFSAPFATCAFDDLAHGHSASTATPDSQSLLLGTQAQQVEARERNAIRREPTYAHPIALFDAGLIDAAAIQDSTTMPAPDVLRWFAPSLVPLRV